MTPIPSGDLHDADLGTHGQGSSILNVDRPGVYAMPTGNKICERLQTFTLAHVSTPFTGKHLVSNDVLITIVNRVCRVCT